MNFKEEEEDYIVSSEFRDPISSAIAEDQEEDKEEISETESEEEEKLEEK